MQPPVKVVGPDEVVLDYTHLKPKYPDGVRDGVVGLNSSGGGGAATDA